MHSLYRHKSPRRFVVFQYVNVERTEPIDGGCVSSCHYAQEHGNTQSVSRRHRGRPNLRHLSSERGDMSRINEHTERQSHSSFRAAIYARVSTTNNGQDPRMQTSDLQEYCARRGWAVAGEYVDIGISGTKEKRPSLDRLLADAHRR
jgi:predicted site-specific integrase-resolvase